MRVFLALHGAVPGLPSNLPATGPVTVAQAATSEGLMQLYMQKFAELPRVKADEVVEGVWSAGRGVVQLGLIGATTALAVSYGLPAALATMAGAMVFAPKQAETLLKGARDLWPGPRP